MRNLAIGTIAVIPDSIVTWMTLVQKSYPVHGIFFMLMVVDVITGLLLAGGKGQLSSSASLVGMSKKVGMMLLVGVGTILEPIADLPLGRMIAMFYIVTEGLSIIENLGKLGVPIPQFLKDFLLKFQTDAHAPNGTSSLQVIADKISTNPPEHQLQKVESEDK